MTTKTIINTTGRIVGIIVIFMLSAITVIALYNKISFGIRTLMGGAIVGLCVILIGGVLIKMVLRRHW